MVSRNPPFGESEIRPCRKGDPMYDDNEPISLSIDYEFLSVLGACYEGLKEFNRVFPEGVTFDWTAETVALLEQIFPFLFVDWFRATLAPPIFCTPFLPPPLKWGVNLPPSFSKKDNFPNALSQI